ncbi:MFS transporter [Sorangium sp. So ce131]|uniref:MFS transporter n=1 Tax=Sorangium sp. So ce131 TaxID=3133282 RepID=UPI003F5DE595
MDPAVAFDTENMHAPTSRGPSRGRAAPRHLDEAPSPAPTPLAARPAPPNLRAARLGVAAAFFSYGAAFASWIVRIPSIREHIGLSPAALGGALFGASLGALVAMPVAGWLAGRVGSRPLIRVAPLALGAALVLPALASSLLTLTLALVAMGLAGGTLNLAVNAQGAAVERAYGRPIFASFHGIYSLGGLAGAALGGAFIQWGVPTLVHLAAVGVGISALAWWATRHTLSVTKPPAAAPTTDAGSRPGLLALAPLGAIAFCVLVGEGAIADWSAVYLRDVVGASPAAAAAGYAAFSIAMTGGRFVSDRIGAALGPRRLVYLGGLASALGLGLALVVPGFWTVIIGFAGVGAGSSVVFPIALRAASGDGGPGSEAAIAAVSTAGFLGFLVGPPLIGLTASYVSLRGALVWVVLASAVVAVLSAAVQRRPGARAAA